jgi:hypothetical protein
MASPAAPSPNGAYLVMLAEDHASARGFQFDEPGRTELRTLADRAITTAHSAGIYTVEDILRDVAPNTIRLTDAIIDFADGVMLRVHSIRQGLTKICPLFPFC